MDTTTKSKLEVMVDDWLSYRFEWDDIPIGNMVGKVTITLEGDSPQTVWENPNPTLPENGKLFGESGRRANWGDTHDGWGAISDQFFTARKPFHELTDGPHLRLTGLLLDSRTVRRLQPDALAGRATYLAVLCHDRETVGTPQEFDLVDLWYPHLCHPETDRLAAGHGWGANRIAVGTTAATIARMAAHETLEMWQSAPNVPVIDPHKQEIECVVTFADGATITTEV